MQTPRRFALEQMARIAKQPPYAIRCDRDFCLAPMSMESEIVLNRPGRGQLPLLRSLRMIGKC